MSEEKPPVVTFLHENEGYIRFRAGTAAISVEVSTVIGILQGITKQYRSAGNEENKNDPNIARANEYQNSINEIVKIRKSLQKKLDELALTTISKESRNINQETIRTNIAQIQSKLEYIINLIPREPESKGQHFEDKSPEANLIQFKNILEVALAKIDFDKKKLLPLDARPSAKSTPHTPHTHTPK